MNLVVIGRVYNERNKLIGVRILDSDNTVINVKDVPTADVINVLASNKVKIQNIGLTDDGKEIEWTNGALERYPKIVHKHIYGRVPCTVIYRTDRGFIVTDHSGRMKEMKESAVIRYAKDNGISNGKIIKKGDTEYISSITGEYKYRENYVGDKLNEEQLKPLAISVHLDDSKVKYNVISIKGEEIKVKETRAIDLTHIEDFSGQLFQFKNYTLCYRHMQRIKLDTSQDIVNFVNNYSNIFNNDIQALAHQAETLSYGEPIEIIMGRNKYNNLSINKKTDSEIIKCLTNAFINGTTYKVFNECKKDTRLKTVLQRKITIEGIDYCVFKFRESYSYVAQFETSTLEYIYKNYKEYTNVKVQNNVMVIRGLDGVYRYDMDKIHNIYKREVMRDPNKTSKALVIGKEYNQSITQSGELQRLSTTLKTVVIPDNVRKIIKNAITLNDNNENIIFGPNIVESDIYVFNIDSKPGQNMVYIKSIEFKGTKYNTFIDEMANYVAEFWKADIILQCKLDGRQLAKLIYTEERKARSISFVNESDTVYISAIKSALIEHVNVNKLLKSFTIEIDKKTNRMSESYETYYGIKSIKRFLDNTKRLVITKLTVQENVDALTEFLNETEAKLKFREDELADRIEKYNSSRKK